MDKVYQAAAAATYAAVIFVTVAMSVGAQAVDDLADEAGGLNPYENWQIILAFVLPLALQQITSRISTRQGQAIAAFGVSVGVTLVGMFLSGELQQGGLDIITTPLMVMVGSIAFYKGFWNPIGVTPSTGEARHA